MVLPRRRRILIVTAAGLRWPSGMVRAMQFRPLFETCDSWSADYTSQHPEFLVRILDGQNRPLRRILVRAARPLVRACEAYWTRRNEDEIVKRAAHFDIVCIVRSCALNLCRRLRQLRAPRVLVDIND